MTALLFIVWIAQVLVAYAVLFFVQLPLRRDGSRALRAVFFAVKVILFVLCAYLSVSVNSVVTWNAGYTFGALYVALGGDILSDIAAFPFVIAGKNKRIVAIRAIAGIVLTLAFMIYGTVNMQTVKAHEINITSAGMQNGSAGLSFVNIKEFCVSQNPRYRLILSSTIFTPSDTTTSTRDYCVDYTIKLFRKQGAKRIVPHIIMGEILIFEVSVKLLQTG